MPVTASTSELTSHPTAALAVGLYTDGSFTPSAMAIDSALGGSLQRLKEANKLNLKSGQSTVILDTENLGADRIIAVSCGDSDGVSERDFRKAVVGVVKASSSFDGLTLALSDVKVSGRDRGWAIKNMIVSASEATYRFDECKGKNETSEAPISIEALCAADGTDEDAANTGLAIANGVSLARDLGNRPGNICTPTHLAEQAVSMAERFEPLSATILEQSDMEAHGMGSFLSVTRGSRQPPKLIVLQYRNGSEDDAPVALVGKGITFDSGGISLKPGAGMDEMKFDMCGAASVLGTVEAVSQLGLPINLVAVIPSCENLPDGQASKPGDIVTSMSGQTIEVLNTDAEGRLILCDALTYTERFQPKQIIDIATLTGACVIALGRHASGLFSNDDELADALLAAGNESGDRAWRLPIWDEYGEQLKSNFADVGNIGGRDAGAITAAAFLSRFTQEQRWAHLDIAGTAWKTGGEKGATGRPVGLLTEFLKHLS